MTNGRRGQDAIDYAAKRKRAFKTRLTTIGVIVAVAIVFAVFINMD